MRDGPVRLLRQGNHSDLLVCRPKRFRIWPKGLRAKARRAKKRAGFELGARAPSTKAQRNLKLGNLKLGRVQEAPAPPPSWMTWGGVPGPGPRSYRYTTIPHAHFRIGLAKQSLNCSLFWHNGLSKKI